MTDDKKLSYYSYLLEIQENYDPIIKLMREQKGTNWQGKAWKGPITQIAQNLKLIKPLATINWVSLPLIGPLLAGTAAMYSQIPIWILIFAGLFLFCAGYYTLVKLYMGKMASINDPRFHVEAFIARKPAEYQRFWSLFVNAPDFKFKTLVANLESLLKVSPTGDLSQLAVFAQTQIDEITRKQERQLEASKEVISVLQNDISSYEEAIVYLIGLLKKINENLYRYINEQFELHDLDFVSGFSLYRVEGDHLLPIINKGTSGSHFHPIDMNNPGKLYAVVDAAKDQDDAAISHIPYEGRKIVAFKMKMLNNETWIWAFHFDLDDMRALSLIEENAIIESRQIRRMIHSLCLVYQKRALATKEVDHHVAS
ncbi:hypothetical protein [Paenibacillus sp. MMO-58]|uniref:hypothetical protein n=1 Tax=Paenibacillus sp. MMO-58 TaxID=3081290 RepID=UPI003018824E